ncbi:hypothetical protein [Nocardia sp. NBC_00403]|uniref:hypothetical protein n=1 Tax=Nocardia sp. NBC_00403 TaxID=2975990 RepID=UPI002E21D8D7
MTLSLVLRRLIGLPLWGGTTLLIAGCIGDALDKPNPDGGVPNLIDSLNSQDFADSICRTGESFMDPSGLGFSKDMICSKKAG